MDTKYKYIIPTTSLHCTKYTGFVLFNPVECGTQPDIKHEN